MTSLVLTLTETLRYRGAIGQWSWVLHRLTGLGVLFFLTLHVIDTTRTAGLTLDEIKLLLAGDGRLQAIAARRLAALDEQRTWLVHAADCTCVDLDDCALFA